MPHHFPKSTVQASIWCNACMKETPWRIADGRRQYCLTCSEKRDQERAERAPEPPAQPETLSLLGPEKN